MNLSLSVPAIAPASEKKPLLLRYAIAGFSNRGIYQYALPLLGLTEQNSGRLDLSDHGQLVGAFDTNPERVHAFNATHALALPVFTSLREMIDATRPDVVLVMGPDSVHCEHIITALHLGCDVIAEKPMVISIEEAERVIAAERETNREIRVAFNFRYAPLHKAIRKIVASGRLGKVTNIEFAYNLDTYHGASYFHRWNRQRKMSGGLQTHKSCHHLDLIQWWLDAWPRQVFALGARNYYGPDGWHNPARQTETALDTATQRQHCPYFQRWNAGKVQDDHLVANGGAISNEPYIYDKEIDIEDTYAAIIAYDNGTMLTYSCNFSAPYEGYRLGINGTLARLEVDYYVAPNRCPFPVPKETKIRLMPLFGQMEEIVVPSVAGGHGGADGAIQQDLFIGIREESRALNLPAGSIAGAYAVATGDAISRSIQENVPVTIPFFERSN